MAERPEARPEGSADKRGLVEKFRELSSPEKWGLLLLMAIALITIGLLYGAWDPGGSGIVGAWVAVSGGILLLYGCLFVFPSKLTGSYEENPASQPRVVVENEIRATLLQALLAAVILIGAVSTWQQFSATADGLKISAEGLKVSRDTHITEQFSQAVEQLGAERVEARLGAAHALDRLTWDARDDEGRRDSLAIYRILADHIKVDSPWPPRPIDEDDIRRGVTNRLTLELGSLRKRAPDIQRALQIVGARNKDLPPNQKFSAFLTDTDLRGAILGDLQLSDADLRGAKLDYADARVQKPQEPLQLLRAQLQGASLRCAHLEGANFTDARLEKADLRDAVLKYAQGLETANLKGAIYNDGTIWPRPSFAPAAYGMEHKAERFVVKGGKVLAVERQQRRSTLLLPGKRLVQNRVIVPAVDEVGADSTPIADAQRLTCRGPGQFRIGVTKCPPRDDRDCHPRFAPGADLKKQG
jgi:uncharacterized protein YjbI with pentapeptide repeats